MNDKRIETKFLVNKIYEKKFLSIIKTLPFGIVKKYNNRLINNIYFDSIKNDCLLDHLDGLNKRYKCRLRWYGDFSDFTKPFIEFKIKNEKEIIKKKIFLIEANKKELLQKKNFLIKLISETLKKNNFVNFIKNYKISRIISYERLYFESTQKKIRFTYDKNIKYKSWQKNKIYLNRVEKFLIRDLNIIEVKHSRDQKNLISKISNKFKIQPQSYSKYVSYRY